MDRMGQFLIAEVNADGANNGKGMVKEAEAIHTRCRTVEEEEPHEALERAWDDISGAELDPMKRGRQGWTKYSTSER